MGLSKSARPDQWDTPAFKAWFAGSKVVDAQGNPQRVYHGTTQTFDKFDLSMGDSKGYYGAGFYFTSSDTDASVNYAGDAGPEGGIIPARAGFTPTLSGKGSRRGDHPRSRGVYRVRDPGSPQLPGSSPLARGLRRFESRPQ